MILKDYQRRVLAEVRGLLEALAEARDTDARARAADPEFGFDWARRAWERCAPARPYATRTTGAGEPLPSFCLKIPTGGGKTLLAVRVIDLVNDAFRYRQTGLVLWVVPTTQIYRQTLTALRDRAHPYRQQLDLASAGRTRILEKRRLFSPGDVADSLCILLLMLPSANRETREQLRMFRDSGGFDRFFPGDQEMAAHRALLERIPNLDVFDQTEGFWGRQIKTSLGNTLRLLRPLIVLDEGHKAYSRNARATLEGFNPCLIVELTATPPPQANVLVEVAGSDLHAEEMIKLDLHVGNRSGASWQDTLLAAVEHRAKLEERARRYAASTGVRIRPICLIQVERTGRDQRQPGIVHADDAREYLLQHPDVNLEHVAVKTSARDDLKEVDDAGGLLARDCPIRFIITKQALQEGWDCAFAYVLAILTRPGSKTALTQLVGRILRQPYARKTGDRWLDESYVFCFRRRGAALLQEVRRGFQREGLGDLQEHVMAAEDGPVQPAKPVVRRQRARFRQAARDLVLPAFMIRDRGEWRPAHYEADLLVRAAWDQVDVSPLFDLPLAEHPERGIDLQIGPDGNVRSSAEGAAAAAARPAVAADATLSAAFASSHLLDVMPNPWRGSELARRVFGALLQRYPRPLVVRNYGYVLEEMRKRLEAERDRLARAVFTDLLESGEMRFIVAANDLGFNRPPRQIKTPATPPPQPGDWAPVPYQLELFDRIAAGEEMNELEHRVATFLDQQERLFFWYRNRARTDYYVQGWKRGRIYADFIFTLKPDAPDAADAYHRVFVIETKGLHLQEAADTAYKRSVFDLCSRHATRRDWAEFVPAMRGKSMRFEVVDEAEWQRRLTELLTG